MAPLGRGVGRQLLNDAHLDVPLDKGLAVSLVQQRDEDYCDDVNFIGLRESDLIVIEEIFSNFKDISGAILSRSEKSKVMGLGPWKGGKTGHWIG